MVVYTYMSEESSPPEGQVIDYSTMTPLPVITYNSSDNTVVFNNHIQTVSGVSSAANQPLVFQLASSTQSSGSDWYPQ